MKDLKTKFIVFSQGWDGMPIAYHLQQEGYSVTVGQIQDKSELKNGDDKEEAGDKKERLSQYEGMVKKVPARELIKALIKVKNKDDYFIFFDQNNLWYYASILLKAGFTNGLFPTKEDYNFEKDRELAMDFVKKNYKGIEIIPFQEFKTVDETISYLESTPGVYVIQSQGDFVSTYVPQTDDEEVAKTQTIGQIEKYRSEYEKGGLIAKTKLINPVEITPQIVFYNGEEVFTDLDIETKNIGTGENNGSQVGCGSNLVISTDENDKINKISFPSAVYEMAQTHTGMFVWDISLYIFKGKLYFGEFCPNRLGYDASMTEMDMAGGAAKYFISIMNGKNPLKNKFGVGIRMFNLDKKSDNKIGIEGIEDNTWLYEAKSVNGEIMSTGSCWDLGVITNSDNSLDKAIEGLYEIKDKFSFKEVYCRTQDDFIADYNTSIIHRYKAINHDYIEASNLKDNMDIKKMFSQISTQWESMEENHKIEISQIEKKLSIKHKKEIESITSEIDNILND